MGAVFGVCAEQVLGFAIRPRVKNPKPFAFGLGNPKEQPYLETHMKTLLFVCLLVCASHFASGQEKECEKFKVGHFQNIENGVGNTLIERTKDYQIERDEASGMEIKLRVTWLDECTYKLKFIEGNDKWNEKGQTWNNPDLIVNIVETGPDYYLQVAKFEGVTDFEYRSKIKKIK